MWERNTPASKNVEANGSNLPRISFWWIKTMYFWRKLAARFMQTNYTEFRFTQNTHGGEKENEENQSDDDFLDTLTLCAEDGC